MTDLKEIELKGVKFKSEEAGQLCFGCAFYGGWFGGLCNTANEIQKCTPAHRHDQKHVIWVKA